MSENRNEFENYPNLAAHIEKFANRKIECSLGEWSDFLGEINKALIEAKRPDDGENKVVQCSTTVINPSQQIIVALTKKGELWRWSYADGWGMLPPIPLVEG